MVRKRSSILPMDQSMARRPGAVPLPGGKALMWLALGAGILALAWFDGGEEPIHQITQEIPVPEAR